MTMRGFLKEVKWFVRDLTEDIKWYAMNNPNSTRAVVELATMLVLLSLLMC